MAQPPAGRGLVHWHAAKLRWTSRAAGRPRNGLELARGDWAVFVREWLADGRQVRAWRWTRLTVGI